MNPETERPIAPGVYAGVPNDAYHRGPGVSKSGLDLIAKSPAHYRAAVISAEPREPTPAQAFGTAFHALLLEPEAFATDYAPEFVPPAGALVTVDDLKGALDGVGVAYKAAAKKDALAELVRAHVPDAVILADARAAHFEANPGVPLDSDTWAKLHSMRDAVRAHPAAAALLRGEGHAELSAYAAEGDQLVRVRPDWWRRDGIIVDVKTCGAGGAAPDEFARSVVKWRYHVQAFAYPHIARRALGAAHDGGDMLDFSMPHTFAFLAVETDARVVDGVAKGVAVYMLDDDAVGLGAIEYARDLETLAECRAFGHWPGYGDAAMSLSLPGWAYTRVGINHPQQENTP